jgi:hypothetical protein
VKVGDLVKKRAGYHEDEIGLVTRRIQTPGGYVITVLINTPEFPGAPRKSREVAWYQGACDIVSESKKVS